MMKFQVLMAESLKIAVFWDVAPQSLPERMQEASDTEEVLVLT
jgi:hypothetical protein